MQEKFKKNLQQDGADETFKAVSEDYEGAQEKEINYFCTQKLKFSLTIFFVFVLVTLSGAVMHEIVRSCTSKLLGNTYQKFYYGELHFGNERMKTNRPVLSEGDWILRKAGKPYPGQDKINIYKKWWIRNQALIELSAKVFIFSMSFAGLIILFIRRKKRAMKFEIIDWIGVILTLFILKQVLLSSVFIIRGAKFCEYGMFTRYFKLPFWGTEWMFLIIGLLISSYVVFKIVPGEKRNQFLIGGFFGGLSGIALWFFVIEKLFFG